MDIKKYTDANRIAWNEAMPYHQKAKAGKFYEAFKKAGYSCLDETVTRKLKEIGLPGKETAQIGCNDGRELLSLKNLGAGRSVGFDISDAAIEEARKLAETSGISCKFVRTDIYEMPEVFKNSFDLIYISIGVLPWMPDLELFFKIAAGLLKTNGVLFIYESHPFLHMFDPSKKDDPFKVNDSYFRKEPWAESGLDYYANTQYDASIHYDFPHTMSDVIGGFMKNKLEIILFEEYEHDISLCYSQMDNKDLKVPMSYILVGRKK